jgi:hypothetical protein
LERYKDPTQPGAAAVTVDKLADFLKERMDIKLIIIIVVLKPNHYL